MNPLALITNGVQSYVTAPLVVYPLTALLVSIS